MIVILNIFIKINRKKISILLQAWSRFLYILWIYLFGGFAYAIPFAKIVIFGDSLSDTGNYYAYSASKIPQSPPYYVGRFSNGLIWVDELQNSMKSQNIVNYAFGGADVSQQQAIFTLTHEIDSYLLTQQHFQNNLHIIWVGANNYLTPNIIFDNQKVNQVIIGLRHDLQRLILAGAQSFVILNLPNLGQAPIAKIFSLQTLLSRYSRLHNQQLLLMIKKLHAQYSHVHFLYGDINKIFHKIYRDPQAYGFDNVIDACYPEHNSKFCANYLFFDWMHPTAKAHKLIAYYIKQSISANLL